MIHGTIRKCGFCGFIHMCIKSHYTGISMGIKCIILIHSVYCRFFSPSHSYQPMYILN